MADTPPSSYTPPPVEKRWIKAPGIVPRNMQALVIGGIAFLMVAVIVFSGKNAPRERVTAVPTQAVVDPNEARIREYRTRIEEQARRLMAEQAQLAEAKSRLGQPPPSQGESPAWRTSAPSAYPGDAGRAPELNALAAEKQKREYASLFASNIALTYRPLPDAQSETSVVSTPKAPVIKGKQSAPDASTGEPQDDLNTTDGKTYRLFEGTVIETVLTNRLDGSFSGPVNCMVTTELHSHDGRRLLIPQGTRVLGEVQKVENLGQQRLAVTFHRLIMPDGYSINLDTFKGLNQIGETGLVDRVNRHYMQVFGVSLAIGAIAGLSQANTRYGSDSSAADAYRQGVATSLSQSSLNILDRFLNVLPTFTIREGHRIKVYLTADLALPAYAAHRLPSDL